MWKEIYKWAFMIGISLGTIVRLYNISKGKYTEEKTPFKNAISMIEGMIWGYGFYVLFW